MNRGGVNNVRTNCRMAVPDEVLAFAFNLYDDAEDWWSLELVGTDRFDADGGTDGQWACYEIADFGTREEPLSWQDQNDGEQVQEDVFAALRQYLNEGKYADVLKSRRGVGAGFVDGDLELLYQQQ